MRDTNYWICQSAGWSVLALANTPMGAPQTATWRVFTANVIQCAFGLAFTHCLRGAARRWQWTRLPLRSLIPTILFATVTVAIVWHLTLLGVIGLFFPALPYPRMLVDIAFGTAFGESAVVLMWSLLYFGFHFFNGYRRTEIEALRLERAVQEAELRALRAQMHPHFIFNALNGIRALVAENPARSQEMITHLAAILRYSLRPGSAPTVSLDAELAVIRDYLALESLRFEERLRFSIDVPEDALGIMIPPMMLQTLVENGVKYGIARLPEGGEIAVAAARRDGSLIMCVTNSGRLEAGQAAGGIGLANVRERLRLIFSDSASFRLYQSAPGLVTAELIIPEDHEHHPSVDRRRRAPGTARAAAPSRGAS